MRRWHCIEKRFHNQNKIIGAEVGVYRGRMSMNLLELMPGLTLYLIDRWCEYSESEKNGDPESKMVYYKKENWGIFKNILIDKIKDEKRCFVLDMDSSQAANEFKNSFFDFVFIDADHSYTGVRKDIKSWLPKIKQGGYLCGHDYTRPNVKKAVHELLENIEIDDNKTWFVKC